MARFTAIPEIPLGGMTDWMYAMLSAMKENVEILTGQRGKDGAAVTNETIRVSSVPPPTMTQVSATGAGFTLEGGIKVAAMDDHVALVNDVQKLSNDVAQLRAVVDQLIKDLKG